MGVCKSSSDRTVVHPDDPRGVAELRAVRRADGAAGEAELLASDLGLRLGPLVVANAAPVASVEDLNVSLERNSITSLSDLPACSQVLDNAEKVYRARK